MSKYLIGRSIENGQNVYVPSNVLSCHSHFIGSTGSGKTTLLIRLISQIMIGLMGASTIFVIDPLGGLAEALLNFIAHPYLCPESVRQRLVYIEAANEDYLMPFNPLQFSSERELHYRTGRTSEVMLRSGRSTDMTLMLRLRRWLHNCFYSVGALGYPPSAAQFLIHPGTEQHNQLISQIPPQLQLEWAEILQAGLRERIHILDSTRNRLNPFFSCQTLNLMLSCMQSCFDVERFMREKKIVIVSLAPQGKIDHYIADAIGGLMLNEIIQTARNLPRSIVNPTMVVLDEFQNYVGEDLYRALPETRQMGVQLALSHQSISQLEQGEVDMRGIIWQARNRFMFANDAEDADILAHELASQNFDPKLLKDQINVFRQKKVGQSIVRLKNLSATNTSSHATDSSTSSQTSQGRSYQIGQSFAETNFSVSEGLGRGSSKKEATSQGSSEGWSETLIDNLEDFYETSSRTYYTFDEQLRIWARKLRRRKTGQAFAKFKDDNTLYDVDIDQVVVPMTPALADLKAKLIEANFANRELFVPISELQSNWDNFSQRLGQGTMVPPHQQAIIEAVSVKTTRGGQDESALR